MDLNMWKTVAGLSLLLCAFAGAHEPPLPKPRTPSVTVECRGRLRHGVVAIGGETTGTTITFNRTIYELQLQDEADQKFAKEHHKEPVIATGVLRKMKGTESKVRWIIDVETLAERDATKDKEGALLTIRGTLRSKIPLPGDSPEITMEAGGHTWPLDLSADQQLLAKAKSLVDQLVLLSGSLEQEAEEESSTPPVIRVKTLDRPANSPAQK